MLLYKPYFVQHSCYFIFFKHSPQLIHKLCRHEICMKHCPPRKGSPVIKKIKAFPQASTQFIKTQNLHLFLTTRSFIPSFLQSEHDELNSSLHQTSLHCPLHHVSALSFLISSLGGAKVSANENKFCHFVVF